MSRKEYVRPKASVPFHIAVDLTLYLAFSVVFMIAKIISINCKVIRKELK